MTASTWGFCVVVRKMVDLNSYVALRTEAP
jgi:hypothetical protein